MTITIEELRKVYDDANAMAWSNLPAIDTREPSFDELAHTHDESLLAVARFVAERQRAVEPTEEMIAAGIIAILPPASVADIELASRAALLVFRSTDVKITASLTNVASYAATMAPFYRAMSAVAPLVVEG